MSMEYYRGMLIQKDRMTAFREHILKVVGERDRVVEIGTGLGTYSMFAAEAGAAEVTAIEGDPIIAVAKAIARMNGYSDRIQFVRGWYPNVNIPTQVDVVIFENYSARLLDSSSFDLLRHVHRNLLKPGGRMIPDRAKIFVAPVFSEKCWSVAGPVGGDQGDSEYGIDWQPSRGYMTNLPSHMPIKGEETCHKPREIADIRLDALPDAKGLAGNATWQFETDTTIHGLSYWFEFEVGKGTWLSNAPGKEPGSWGNLFLPIDEAFTIPAGSSLSAHVAPEITSEGTPNWLTWRLECGDWSYSGHEFKSFPASLADILPSSPSWIPELSDEAEIERMILAAVDGTRSIESIAKMVHEKIPVLSKEESQNYVLRILGGRTKATSRVTRS